jgi:hypothetical protein
MSRALARRSVLVAAALAVFATEAAAEDHLRRLSGPQIRAKLAGMQLTDEVHWRAVYERDGRLRSYAMGRKVFGTWFIRADELCLDLPEPDGGCFEVSMAGERVVLNPTGLGLPLDGIVRAPAQGE